jgi:hypothetical protein
MPENRIATFVFVKTTSVTPLTRDVATAQTHSDGINTMKNTYKKIAGGLTMRSEEDSCSARTS